MVRNNDRAETWRLTTEDVSRWDLLNIILFAELVLQSRTRYLCSKTTLKYSEAEPALQCRR